MTNDYDVLGNVFGDNHAPYTFNILYVDYVNKSAQINVYKSYNPPYINNNSQMSPLLSNTSFIPVFIFLILS